MIDKLASSTPPTKAPDSPELAKLRKVGAQFEAVFMRQMIGAMRQAGLGDELFGNSATEQFRDMSDAKLADTMAQKGTLGIADVLVKQLGARLATPAATAAPGKDGDKATPQ